MLLLVLIKYPVPFLQYILQYQYVHIKQKMVHFSIGLLEKGSWTEIVLCCIALSMVWWVWDNNNITRNATDEYIIRYALYFNIYIIIAVFIIYMLHIEVTFILIVIKSKGKISFSGSWECEEQLHYIRWSFDFSSGGWER